MRLRRENISRTLSGAATQYLAAFKESQGRNFDSDVQFGFYEITNVGVDLSGSFEDDKCSGLCNSKINGLSGRWIGGICITIYQDLT